MLVRWADGTNDSSTKRLKYFYRGCPIGLVNQRIILYIVGFQGEESGNPGWEPQKLAKKGCDAKIRAQFTATTGSHPSGKRQKPTCCRI